MNQHRLLEPHEKNEYRSSPEDPYAFSVKAYPMEGDEMRVESGDSLWSAWAEDETFHAAVTPGPALVRPLREFSLLVRGYAPQESAVKSRGWTHVPYIAGCSTATLIAPQRPGDPTAQLLHMPAGSREQAHHVHATARVIHVFRGGGRFVAGLGGREQAGALETGATLILPAMTPHHFEATDSAMLLATFHVWSDAGGPASSPVLAGTHRT